MNWTTIFTLYIFRFLQNMTKVTLNKEKIFFPFNTIINTKTNSMFTSFQEDLVGTNKTITCTTYLGEKKIENELVLINATASTITSHTIKYLETVISINGTYKSYNIAHQIGTQEGELKYKVYIGEEIFEITLVNDPLWIVGNVSVDREDAFILGTVNIIHSSPDYMKISFSLNLFYTSQEELSGLDFKITRPTVNTLGKSVIWEKEQQKIMSVKYWDIDEGQIVQTSFDGIYFDNL